MAFTIGQLGRATGTKVETIRYYERAGLLAKPGRTAGNYRAYTQHDLERLSFVRRARDLGFPLEQVRELLALSDDSDRSCMVIDEITTAHLASVERKIADLEALRGELQRLLQSCRGGTMEQCRIIASLAPNGRPAG